MQELTVDRAKRVLLIDGAFECYILENQGKLIPPGHYKLLLTPSARAAAGKLWTPWSDFQLPLLDNVPGREGIRIHAANLEAQLEGCIAVGVGRANVELLHSRLALNSLKDKLCFPAWIEVK